MRKIVFGIFTTGVLSFLIAQIPIGGGGGSSISTIPPFLSNAYAPIFAVTPPPGSGWSFQNQQSCTTDTTYALTAQCPTTAAFQFAILGRTLPVAPYTITFGIRCLLVDACGAFLVNTSTGANVRFWYNNTATSHSGQISIDSWSNLTGTFSSTFLAETTVVNSSSSPITWLRIQDDSTNRIFWISIDGVHFTKVFTQLNNTFITPNFIGIGTNLNSTLFGAAGTWNLFWSILSYVQA